MSVTSHEQIRILHVDDDSDFADLTATFLERESDRYAVETATSADERLERINDRPPDCVVSDYNMPGMDGLEFLQAVREDNPDLPFILYTGKGSEAVASEAIAADVTDYLQKGSGSEQYELLANRIRNAVQARREAQRADRQEQLIRLTEFAGDTGGFELDTETGEMLLTDGFLRLMDLPAQADLTLDEAIDLYHPEDREDIRQTIDRARQTGEQTHGTWRLQAQDGNERIVDVTFTSATTDGDKEILHGSVHDVTDQHERKHELRRNKRAMDEVPVGMTISDPSQGDHPLIHINDRFEELTGYDKDEIVGRNWQFLHGDDTREEPVAEIREAIDAKDPVTVELRNYRKDGTEFWNRVSIAPVRDDEGSVVNFVGFQQDITDHRQREQELERTTDLVSNMEQLADVGAWEYDPKGETLMLTDGTSRIHGLEPDADLSVEAAFENFHPDDRDLLEDRFDACLATGESYEMDVRLTRPDGEQRWITASGERVNDGESGKVVRGYIQDITEERRQRMQLEETAARLGALFDRSPDMINVHDTDGNILDVNQQLAERTGYAKHELTEMNVWDIDACITPDEARTLWRDMDPDDRRQVEGVYKCRDGSTFPVEVHVRRLDIEDDDLFVVISRDITEQTERERELYTQNERLDEFASIVSHDLRSPLAVADGYLELAQETGESDDFDQVADAIDRCQALIDDLLELARDGETVSDHETVALADVAERSWQTVETNSATFETHATHPLRTDRSRLQELVENLYRNALEHGDDVTVSVGAMDDGFYVADTGPGIPEADREEIFEAGYSTNEDGTGFGLRIVKQIANAHGWEITVTESEQGGARFEITGVEFVDS